MRATVLKSTRNDSLYAQLPNCVSFFNKDILATLEVGREYEFMIVGYSKSTKPADGLPSAVFLDLVTEQDVLVEAPILSTSGSMCVTSTFHKKFGDIYPGMHSPVPVVDNTNNTFYDMPTFPQPIIPIWIRKTPNNYRAIGVESYEHIQPVFALRPDIQRVQNALDDRHNTWSDYIKNPEGKNLQQLYDDVRTRHGIVKQNANFVFAN